ncbi:hypothetical protein H0H92_009710 [Tricholoma furcatifolium]|nr:hypothetical protein H0H92_009710 [Tricholoma furcatifolium]
MHPHYSSALVDPGPWRLYYTLRKDATETGGESGAGAGDVIPRANFFQSVGSACSRSRSFSVFQNTTTEVPLPVQQSRDLDKQQMLTATEAKLCYWAHAGSLLLLAPEEDVFCIFSTPSTKISRYPSPPSFAYFPPVEYAKILERAVHKLLHATAARESSGVVNTGLASYEHIRAVKSAASVQVCERQDLIPSSHVKGVRGEGFKYPKPKHVPVLKPTPNMLSPIFPRASASSTTSPSQSHSTFA